MNIMIAGNKGQLGSDCEKLLGTDHTLWAVDLDQLDITNLADVEKGVKAFSPNWILNCAAYTLVDLCETEKKPAWNVNVVGPKNLASAAKKYGSRLLHISTDYVFDGSKSLPAGYIEDDEPNPKNYYGITKLAGENAVRSTLPQHVIVRTAWLYGISGKNFLKTMLRLALLDPRKEIKVVDDQYGSPTWSFRLAQQTARLIEANAEGTFHAASEGYCTWYELARYFLDKMEVPHRMIPCTTEEYPTPAARPKNSILENRNLNQTGLNIMAHWQEDLEQFVLRFRNRLINEAMFE